MIRGPAVAVLGFDRFYTNTVVLIISESEMAEVSSPKSKKRFKIKVKTRLGSGKAQTEAKFPSTFYAVLLLTR